MRKISCLFYILTLLLIFSACRKDEIVIDKDQTPLPPEVIVETSITGIVTDRNGQPLESTLVTMQGTTVETDVNGYFLIHGQSPERSALLTIEKDGYFKTVHAVTPIKQDTSITRIQLIQRQLSGAFAADQGGVITMSNGAAVTFAADGFIDAQGNPYTGEVNVYAHPLDPTDPDISAFMPGDLTAIDQEENYVGLKSYGMINVELENGAGNSIQISKEATIRIPVPPSLRNTSPSTIPLWYFDVEDGLWKEEGMARIENNVYTGQVSHFTFWNCDVSFPLVNIEGNIRVGEFGVRLKVRITRADGSTGCVYTTGNGTFAGKVPQDESLTIDFIDVCGDIVYTDNIGPFSTDTELGTFNVPLSNSYVFVSGFVNDCNQDPVSNGYAVINPNGQGESYRFTTFPNGFFNGLIATCGATELEAYGVDVANKIFGDNITIAISDPADLGTLSACGNEYVEGVEFRYGGDAYTIDNCIVSVDDTTGGTRLFTFGFVDDQMNGDRVIYTANVFDLNSNPSNPFWIYGSNRQIVGNPDPIFEFGNGELNIIEEGQNPGEYIILSIDNAFIINTATSDTLGLGQVNITAQIQ